VLERGGAAAPGTAANAGGAPGPGGVGSGDKYLNEVKAEIERNRFYPAPARALGLTGRAVLGMIVDRSGHLLGIKLRKSTGVGILDRAAEEIVRKSAPLPPLPADYPGDAVEIEVALYMYPT
jgi:protein TonB